MVNKKGAMMSNQRNRNRENTKPQTKPVEDEVTEETPTEEVAESTEAVEEAPVEETPVESTENIINDDNVILYKSSDDGEPSQTAGAPILNVIKRNNLTNVLCVVVRYFGGIKLGAGGLTRASTKACAGVLSD